MGRSRLIHRCLGTGRRRSGVIFLRNATSDDSALVSTQENEAGRLDVDHYITPTTQRTRSDGRSSSSRVMLEPIAAGARSRSMAGGPSGAS